MSCRSRDGQDHLNTELDKIANLKAGNDCDGNSVFLTLSEDGKSYSVTVPRTGHIGTYLTR